MLVSTRAFSATLAIGVTVPSASRSTGTCLRSALATSTGTTRLAAPRADRAAAPSVVQKPRTSTATPIRASNATPKSHFRLVICYSWSGLRSGPARTSPFSADFAIFGTARAAILAYKRPRPPIPAAGHGKYVSRPDCSTPFRNAHAHCHLERQFGPPAARAPSGLAERAPAGHRLPAGDQVHR